MTLPEEPRRAPRPKGPIPAIPLTILTGFLGAGKTSLLNALLREPDLADTVVIINEFGEIGLDHLLVEKADEGMVTLASGCLCCTIRGDLISTLEDLLRRRDNGRIVAFRRVVIETTGLADPAPVLHTVLYHPYLAKRFAIDGVITVVDAVNGAATLDTHIEALKQAAVADRLVISKTDLPETSEADVTALKRRLAALNPAAPILDIAQGEAKPAALLGIGLYDVDGKIADVRAWLQAEAFDDSHRDGHGHHHGHDHAGDDHHHGHRGHDHEGHHHHHDVNRHDARIRAFCLTSTRPITAHNLDLFLDLLRASHGPNLLRVKGLVALADDPDHPMVIHGVQHVFHQPIRLDRWPDGDRRSRLVFILRDLDESFVSRLWNAFLGEPSIDAPDAAALTANPLALGGGR
ncbi:MULTISPECIES: GTP-binding protein [unclassified Chelatococcus]|uniref:CobW family GTP-binding protein n=1 Tax=unclassified Chelatococcus TaxID=2638111 RepID=UPI001BCE8581|nr:MULTISPECIES: GTP-binding protein [unclassified Chelatococcus]MBS7697107.1 GTP-binding protein [Chelatococcus sp. YT9]MBX3556097.1 GTP-binding protein [Chelatococcus sp.]